MCADTGRSSREQLCPVVCDGDRVRMGTYGGTAEQLATDMYLSSRWPTLAVSIFLETVAGVGYVFSLYTAVLKQHFGLSQRRVDLIGTAENSSAFIAFMYGMIYQRCGPRLSLTFAGIAAVSGWLLLWGAFQVSWPVPYKSLLVLAFLQGTASSIVDVTAVSIVIDNFPERRGQALGLAKAFIGLSASLYASGYTAFFAPDVVTFIMCIGFAYAVSCLLGVFALSRPPPGVLPETETAGTPSALLTKRRLSHGLLWVVVLMIVLIGGSLIGSLSIMPEGFATLMTSATFGLYGSGLLYMGWPSGLVAQTKVPMLPPDFYPLTGGSSSLPRPAASKSDGKPVRAELGSITWFTLLLVALVFASMFLAFGGGLMLINNLESLHKSRTSDPDADPAIFVTLTSASNGAGRLLAGYASDIALYRFGVPRPVAMSLSHALFALAMLALLTSGGVVPLYVACILGGMAYGAINVLAPACISEIFGIAMLPVLYPLLLGPAFSVGSLVFATLIYGTTFDAALERHGLTASEACRYPDCYAPSIVIACCASVLAALIWLIITRATRPQYAHFRKYILQ